MSNLHLVVPPDQWTEPDSAHPDKPLELQITRTGQPDEDGMVPVEGWRYGGENGDQVEPARGVRVAAYLIPRQR